MRTLLLLVSASLLLLTLASCDDNQAVRQAYQKGAADAIQEVQARVGQSKQQLMGELQPTLLIGAIIVLLLASTLPRLSHTNCLGALDSRAGVHSPSCYRRRLHANTSP